MPRSTHISVDDKVRDVLSVTRVKQIEVLDAKLLYQTDKHSFSITTVALCAFKMTTFAFGDRARNSGASAASAASSSGYGSSDPTPSFFTQVALLNKAFEIG